MEALFRKQEQLLHTHPGGHDQSPGHKCEPGLGETVALIGDVDGVLPWQQCEGATEMKHRITWALAILFQVHTETCG
jgi:hypothetical protein